LFSSSGTAEQSPEETADTKLKSPSVCCLKKKKTVHKNYIAGETHKEATHRRGAGPFSQNYQKKKSTDNLHVFKKK
jgi:hypothetical protein